MPLYQGWKFGGSGAPSAPTQTITWSFAAANYGEVVFDLFGPDLREFRAEIKHAFAMWSTIANVNFKLVADSQDVDIRMGFGYIDGGGNTLAEAYTFRTDRSGYDRVDNALIVFDESESFLNFVGDIRANIVSVAAHEIGHVLGLAHNDNTPAQMNTTYHWGVPGLYPDDMNGMRNLYGARHPEITGSVVYDGNGDGYLYGTPGQDLLKGFAGNDEITGGNGNDSIDGGTGNDGLNGGDGEDLVIGGRGNDELNGDFGNDTVVGGVGNDVLGDSWGTNVLDGGPGNDLYTIDAHLDPSTYQNQLVDSGGIDTIRLGYRSWGSDPAIVVYTLPSGIERLTAVHIPADTLSTFIYEEDARYTGNGAANYMEGLGKMQVYLLNLQYQEGGNDQLRGLAGNDTLVGLKGDDLLLGGDGDDRLVGDTVDDTFILINSRGEDIEGDSHNDTLIGGAGADMLKGGVGLDAFRLDSTSGVDVIRDFSAIDDTIQPLRTVFPNLAAGALSSGNYRASLDGTAADGNDYILYETDTGRLYYDSDGNASGTRMHIATLWDSSTTHPTASEISYTDFFVV